MTRHRIAVLAFAAALVIGACVPEPDGRSASPTSPEPSAAVATPSPTPAPTGPSPSPSFIRPTPLPSPTFFVYLVRTGDTLSSIGRRFSTNAFSLAVWNRDTYPSLDPESEGYAPDRIQVGWQLRLIPGRVVDEEELLRPTPTPGASATPTRPSASPSGAGAATPPPVSRAATVVRHGSRSTPTVALTFDMGGRLDPALDIVGWLIEHDVSATIFPTGRTVAETADGRAVMELVAGHREQFDVGNHSWSHPDFRDLDAEAMRSQLERTQSALLSTVNLDTRPWFRPPYGGVDDQVPAVVGAAGWTSVVLWDIDTIDWRPESDGGPSAADMVDKVVDRAEGGSIVLMHLGGYRTLEALPGIIDGLRDRGLRPVTLSEMLGEG